MTICGKTECKVRDGSKKISWISVCVSAAPLKRRILRFLQKKRVAICLFCFLSVSTDREGGVVGLGHRLLTVASGPFGEVFFFRMRGLRALSAGFICVGSKLAIEFVFAWLPVSKVTNFLHVASFDGKACSRGGDEEDATLRSRMSTLGPQRRAANLLLRMTDIARKVCMAVGKDHF